MELLSKLGHLWLLDHSLRPVVRIWFLGWSLKPWIIRRSIINQVILSTKLIIVPLELRFVRNRINLEVGGYRWLLWVPWDIKLVLFYQSVIILLIWMSFVQLLLGRVPSDRSWLFFVWIVILWRFLLWIEHIVVWVPIVSKGIDLVRRRGVTLMVNYTDRRPHDSSQSWRYFGLVISVSDSDLSDRAFVI